MSVSLTSLVKSTASLLSTTYPVLDEVLPGLLRGSVGILHSPGGVGKSFWSLGVGFSIGVSDVFGFGSRGGVLYVGAEDSEAVLASRLHAFQGRALAGDLRFEDSALEILPVSEMDGRLDITNEQTQCELIELCKGKRLLVLDTLRRMHSLNENDSNDMLRVMNSLERIAKLANVSVLAIHHDSKVATAQGAHTQQSARGSSVLVDNARWASTLVPMTHKEAKMFRVSDHRKYVQWVSTKMNYGPAKDPVWFEVDTNGAMAPVSLTSYDAKGAVVATTSVFAPLKAAQKQDDRERTQPVDEQPGADLVLRQSTAPVGREPASRICAQTIAKAWEAPAVPIRSLAPGAQKRTRKASGLPDKEAGAKERPARRVSHRSIQSLGRASSMEVPSDMSTPKTTGSALSSTRTAQTAIPSANNIQNGDW